jgi:acetyltransferase-like isoleucine patch superfamily enzyme
MLFVETKKGKNVVIFPNCVIGRKPMAPSGITEIDYNKVGNGDVFIGDNTVIGANTVIYSNVKIGKNCLIGDGVHIREDVEIGDNCIIGISTKVGARTKIGNYTRVMDLTNVASDAILGNHVFCGPAVIMANDNAMSRDKTKGGFDFIGPIIEDWATIGSNASILPNVRIGKDAMVGASSVVTRDVSPGTVVMGIPARFKRNLREDEIRIKE